MIPITQGCSPGDYDCAGWNDRNNIEGQEFGGSSYNKQAYLLSKQFKASKICLLSDSNDYKNDECKNIESIISKNNWMAHVVKPSFFINNDATIWMILSASIGVDINGIKGPNKWGRDQFVFEITDQYKESRYGIPQGTVVPFGSKLYDDIGFEWANGYWRNNNYCTTENANKGDWSAADCTGRVLEEDAMNY